MRHQMINTSLWRRVRLQWLFHLLRKTTILLLEAHLCSRDYILRCAHKLCAYHNILIAQGNTWGRRIEMNSGRKEWRSARGEATESSGIRNSPFSLRTGLKINATTRVLASPAFFLLSCSCRPHVYRYRFSTVARYCLCNMSVQYRCVVDLSR